MEEKKQDNEYSPDNTASGAKPGQFASLSMHMRDRLRLLNFPFEIQHVVREVIIAHWPRGIVSERTYASSHEFKLSGLPWQCHVGDSVTSRRLVTRVLEALYNLGWIINVTAKVSHGLSDLDTLLFQYGTHSHRHPDLQGQIQYEWITVGFSTSDRLCLIDAPLDLIKTVMQTLGDSVESDLGYTYLGGYELKLNGTPWRATGEATMRTRQLALKVLEALRDHGWSVYASVDQKSTARDDADTWHCRRPRDWLPEIPGYSST